MPRHLPIAACLLLIGAAAAPSDAADKQRVAELEAQNAALRAKVKALESLVAKLEQKLTALETQLGSASKALDDANNRARTAEAKRASAANAVTEQALAAYLRRGKDEKTGRPYVGTVRSRMKFTHGTRDAHEIRWTAHSAAEGPTTIALHIDAWSSGTAYKTAKTVELTLDEKDGLSLPVADYRSRFKTTGRQRKRSDDQFVTATVMPQQLARLAKAGAVTGKIGPNRFALTADQLTAIKALHHATQK